MAKNKPVKYHVGKFPPKNLELERLLPLVGDAREAVGRYDGLLFAIPNANVMLSPLTTQEAVLSSKIEGTRATMGDVLGFEAGGLVDELDERMRGDIQEVINYRAAMKEAATLLEKIPLCQRMIKSLHKTLLDGVRGHNKHRGKFRTIQNWIGNSDNMEEAKFVPIEPGKPLEDGLTTWEKYIHKTELDPLIQLALIHAEFESLHPFIDGNGRIGRMMVPIYLFEKKLLHAPTFYVSAYLERNRDEYYQRLRKVSSDDDWTGWCLFFLTAIKQQAEENEAKVRLILDLYERCKSQVIELTHSQHAIHALDYIFDQPVFNSTSFKNGSQIPDSTARRILSLFTEDGLLRVIRNSSGKRPRVLAFVELIEITEGKAVF